MESQAILLDSTSYMEAPFLRSEWTEEQKAFCVCQSVVLMAKGAWKFGRIPSDRNVNGMTDGGQRACSLAILTFSSAAPALIHSRAE